MKKITPRQRELVDAVIAEKNIGGLTAAILEKDIHVTDALHALCAMRNEMPISFFAEEPASQRPTQSLNACLKTSI